MTDAGTSLEKGCYPEIKAAIEIIMQAIVGPGQDLESVQMQTE